MKELEKVVNAVVNQIKEATKAITKTRLPNEFMNNLIVFGKTEDDILEYFTKYHNDNGFRFLNEVEELMTQFPTLTKGETYCLWGYTTNHFYAELNLWLRQGINLSKTEGLTTMLNSALNKLSNFNGSIIYRGLNGDVADLISKYSPGSSHTWGGFTSCGSSKGASFVNKTDIIFEIKHLDAKNISAFADGIKYRGYPPSELLIKSGSEFKVISNNKIDALSGKPIIELLQIK